MRRRPLLYVLATALGLALGTALAVGCGTPGPVPPTPVADAGPPDAPAPGRFTGRRFDCHGQDLAVREVALEKAAICLSGIEVAACISAMADDDRTVACAVRDVGAKANAEALANGPGDVRNEAIADAARQWLRAEGLGFQ